MICFFVQCDLKLFGGKFKINPLLHFKLIQNKKVLLRECKRHTAYCVVSTPSVVLTGYLPPVLTWPGGYPTWHPWQGTPHPDLAGGYPTWDPLAGYPPAGYPPGRVPPGQGTPIPPLAGYPLAGPGRAPPRLDLAGYPPRLTHGILGNVAKHYGIWVPPCGQTDRHVSKHYLPVVLRTRAVKNG